MTERAPERDLVALFAKALRRLGDAGRPEEASELAAQAWWGLKDENPRAAEHINGVMHYLARLPQTHPTPGPPQGDSVAAQATPDVTTAASGSDPAAS